MSFSPKGPLPVLAAHLERELGRPLPGWSAQARLAPHPPREGPPHRALDAGRPAAGLLLLYPRNHVVHFVLTVRSDALPSHPGQVGLPGGRVEPRESLQAAALRETREEIGVDSGEIRIAGALTPVYIPPSDSRLHPFVAWTPRTPVFRPHVREVERILEVPLAALLEPDALEEETRSLRAGTTVVPYYGLEGEKVWGATGMVLAEFVAVLAGLDDSGAPGSGQKPDPDPS